jgi:hypothetical protein
MHSGREIPCRRERTLLGHIQAGIPASKALGAGYIPQVHDGAWYNITWNRTSGVAHFAQCTDVLNWHRFYLG